MSGKERGVCVSVCVRERTAVSKNILDFTREKKFALLLKKKNVFR